jgi:large subunit ribosomal protein L32e
MTAPKAITPEKALKLRERVKRKKPEFVRQESWKYIRLKENWRRPRGLDNKVKKRIKGWPPLVSSGYRGPKVSRGLHPSGFEEILVYNTEHLKQINPKIQAVRIAHTVGKRKRVKIITEAKKKKITVLNLKEAREAVEKEKESTEETEKEEEKLKEKEEAKETEEPEKEKVKKRRKGTKQQ